jgi:hypothetical protein
MIQYSLEYFLCYKEAFIYGVICGFLITYYLGRKRKTI